MFFLLSMKLVAFFLADFLRPLEQMVQDICVQQASLSHIVVEVYSVSCDVFQLSLNVCLKWGQYPTLDLYSQVDKSKVIFNLQQLSFCTALFIPKASVIQKIIQKISFLFKKKK